MAPFLGSEWRRVFPQPVKKAPPFPSSSKVSLGGEKSGLEELHTLEAWLGARHREGQRTITLARITNAALRYFLPGGSPNFPAILTNSASELAFIFLIARPR